MLYCNDCGQCSFISNDAFYEDSTTRGWERSIINCENGEHIECIDSDITDSDHLSFECPHCEGEDIEACWQGNEEEAIDQREAYETEDRNHRQRLSLDRMEREKELQAKDPQREWDVVENV